MKSIFISVLTVVVLAFAGSSFAIDVPPPPIDIDISNSYFEKIDSTSFRVRQLIAPDYPGSYWVDFLWNPDQLLFEPTNVDAEASASSGKHRVAIVDKSDKFYSDPIAAMSDLPTWCGTPSSTNPCLVKILPGVYDIGTNTLQMQSYVDIEGSGENITKIKGSGSGYDTFSIVIEGAKHSELRSLTVEHTGSEDYSIAVVGYPLQKLTNITAISTEGAEKNYGVYCAVEVILFSENFIQSNSSAPLKISNATVIASGGNESVGVENGPVIIEKSSVTGSTYSIRVYNETYVVNTQIDGPVGGFPGMTTCAGVYDENFTFYANTCP
jgi:hypothetical protein